MCKMLLRPLKEKIDLEQALKSIGTEESYLNLDVNFYEIEEEEIRLYQEERTITTKIEDGEEDIGFYLDNESNYLFGVYELLDAYANDLNYGNYFPSHKAIGKKVKRASFFGNSIEDTEEKLAMEKNDKENKTLIELERDTLVIEQGYAVYVNNNERGKAENKFTQHVNEIIKNKVLEDIKFNHYTYKDTPNISYDGRTTELFFSDGIKLTYFYDIENKIEGVRLREGGCREE